MSHLSQLLDILYTVEINHTQVRDATEWAESNLISKEELFQYHEDRKFFIRRLEGFIAKQSVRKAAESDRILTLCLAAAQAWLDENRNG